jgi:hypothetical protein
VAQSVDEEEAEGVAGAAVEELMFGGRDNGGKGPGRRVVIYRAVERSNDEKADGS